jgi:hypothetical protein
MPGYWLHETSGVLRPAVEAYLAGGESSAAHVATLCAYFRQWMEAAPWGGADELRAKVDGLTSRATIEDWLDQALDLGIDPL